MRNSYIKVIYEDIYKLIYDKKVVNEKCLRFLSCILKKEFWKTKTKSFLFRNRFSKFVEIKNSIFFRSPVELSPRT